MDYRQAQVSEVLLFKWAATNPFTIMATAVIAQNHSYPSADLS